MIPMGWNQLRQARVPGPQMNTQPNNMAASQQSHFQRPLNQQQPFLNHHLQQQGYNPKMNHQQSFNAALPQQSILDNQHQVPYDIYPQQQYMQQQQQMFQQQMMPFHMAPQQVMMQPAQKPPEPKGSPPPSPLPPLPKDEPPPPPTVEAKWWVAELEKLPSAHLREQLERLVNEKWFHTMNMHQQIECWQHKMQLISTQNKGATTGTGDGKIVSSNAIISAPAVSAPSPMRKADFQQTGNIDKDLETARLEERSIQDQITTYEKQYGEWRKQFEAWKEKHKAHPNKEQFIQYESQWMKWQNQMSEQKNNYDRNLKAIRTQIQDLEKRKLQSQNRQVDTAQRLQDNVQNQNLPNNTQEQANFQNQESKFGNQQANFMHSRFGEQIGKNQQFTGVQGDPRFPNQIPHGANFGGNQGLGPRFSDPGAPNSQPFPQQRPRFNGPGDADMQRMRHPLPGQLGPNNHFNLSEGEFPHGAGHRLKNNRQFRGGNPNGPRFHHGGPQNFVDENFGNDEDHYKVDESQFDNEHLPQSFPHDNQAIIGNRQGFRPRGNFQPRQRPPLRGQMNSNRFQDLNPTQLRPHGRGFQNHPRYRGQRPPFSGQGGRFPQARGRGFMGPRHRFPGNFDAGSGDKYGEGMGDYNEHQESGYGEFNMEMQGAEQEGQYKDVAESRNNPPHHRNEFFNDDFTDVGYNYRTPIQQSIDDKGNDDKAGEGMENSETQRKKNLESQKEKGEENLEKKDRKNEGSENTKGKTSSSESKPTKNESVPHGGKGGEEQTTVDPENDYSHYMTDEYMNYEEKQFNQPEYDDFPPSGGRGRDFFRGRRGRGGTYRGRGNAFPGRGMAKPPHMLMQEAGEFNVKNNRKHGAPGPRENYPGFNSEQYQDDHGPGDQGTAETPEPAIDTEAIMQKAKELSNFDIKNLLSAVKSVKSQPSSDSSLKASSSVNEPGRPEKDYNLGNNRQRPQYRARARDPYSDLYRDNLSDPITDSLLNENLTEAELLAAGLDPVSLGLREEDLLLQQYLLDPMLHNPLMSDPLARDPYLEREMMIRTLREEREAALRETELRRQQLAASARPPIHELKIVETIDYSHGLSKTKSADTTKLRDGDYHDEPREYRKSPRDIDNDRMSPRGDSRRSYRADRLLNEDYGRGRSPPPRSNDRLDRHTPRRGEQAREHSSYSPSSSVVVAEDVIREQESMERQRVSIDHDRRFVEQRRSTLDKTRNSKEREEERSKRERSLERLRNMERELIEREKVLNEREQRLKIPDRERKARFEERGRDGRWKSDRYSSSTRDRDQSPRRRFEERPREGESERRFRERTPPSRGREWDRGKSPSFRREGRDRFRERSPHRADHDNESRKFRGRDDRRSPDSNRNRPPVPRDRRRFTSPSGDSMRISSLAARRPPTKMVKIDPVYVRVEDLLNDPARQQRPKRIAIVLRGLPGSGKSHIAKLIRDTEAARGVTPRVLGLDDYFMVENEKFQKDKETGRIVKKKVIEYEYEAAMEPTYRESLVRSFKKTLEDGYFNFVVVDSINDKVAYFSDFWTIAKKASFEVYVAELTADVHVCAKRNDHKRKLSEIQKLAEGWEETPSHMIRLDVRQMLQASEIQEVEMGDVSDEESNAGVQKQMTIEEKAGVPQSKWELMEKMERLDKLDGIKKKRLQSSQQDMADFLSVTEDYVQRSSAPGKKRVMFGYC